MKLEKLIKMKNNAFKILMETKKQLDEVINESHKRIDVINEEAQKLEVEKIAIESIITQSTRSVKEIDQIMGVQ